MVLIEMETHTLAVLIAGIYCTNNQIDSMAIPQSVWLAIAEKLEYYIGNGLWDFSKISFEQWLSVGLFIIPKPLLDESDIKDMQDNTMYWEVENGNIILIVSMDIRLIDGGD